MVIGSRLLVSPLLIVGELALRLQLTLQPSTAFHSFLSQGTTAAASRDATGSMVFTLARSMERWKVGPIFGSTSRMSSRRLGGLAAAFCASAALRLFAAPLVAARVSAGCSCTRRLPDAHRSPHQRHSRRRPRRPQTYLPPLLQQLPWRPLRVPWLPLLAPCSLPVLGLPRLSCHCAFGLFSFHLIDGANELRKFRVELLIAADDGLDGVVAASNFLPHRKICSVPYTTPRRSLSLPRRLPFHRQGPRTPMRRCSVAVARRERAQQVCFLARDFRLARVWAGTPRRYSKSSAGRPCGGG